MKNSTEINWLTEEYERFNFMMRSFDVTEAKKILKNKKHKSENVNVEVLFDAISDPDSNRISILNVVVDHSKVAQADLEHPLIFTSIKTKEGIFNLCIDGWHRIAKAKTLGIKELPAFFLNQQETKKISR